MNNTTKTNVRYPGWVYTVAVKIARKATTEIYH